MELMSVKQAAELWAIFKSRRYSKRKEENGSGRDHGREE